MVLTQWRHYKVFPNWSEAINADTVLGRPVDQTLSQIKLPSLHQTNPAQPEDCGCEMRGYNNSLNIHLVMLTWYIPIDILRVPSFYIATFSLSHLPSSNVFLNVGSCGFKGVAFMNGFNLGRYWPVMGPQVTLYIPRATLSTTTPNKLVLFELDRDSHSCLTIYLTNNHILNGTTPKNYESTQNSDLTHHQRKQLGIPLGWVFLYF